VLDAVKLDNLTLAITGTLPLLALMLKPCSKVKVQ